MRARGLRCRRSAASLCLAAARAIRSTIRSTRRACHGAARCARRGAPGGARRRATTINPRFDCIDRRLLREVEQGEQAWLRRCCAKRRRRRRRRARGDATSLMRRAAVFTTDDHGARERQCHCRKPPAESVRAQRLQAAARDASSRRGSRRIRAMAQKHPAIIWLTGGDTQFARRFLDRRQAAQRPVGERIPQGRHHHDVPDAARRKHEPRRARILPGEVDDVLAAAEHLARLPYVDPAAHLSRRTQHGRHAGAARGRIERALRRGVRVRAGRRESTRYPARSCRSRFHSRRATSSSCARRFTGWTGIVVACLPHRRRGVARQSRRARRAVRERATASSTAFGARRRSFQRAGAVSKKVAARIVVGVADGRSRCVRAQGVPALSAAER